MIVVSVYLSLWYYIIALSADQVDLSAVLEAKKKASTNLSKMEQR